MKARMYQIGKLNLNGKVVIGDPCYEKRDKLMYKVEECQSGEYVGYAYMRKLRDWGERVTKLAIYKGDEKKQCRIWLGNVFVDAGLMSFFTEKVTLNGNKWTKFCDLMYGKDYAKYKEIGLISSSGLGDGYYEVFTNKDRTAFEVRFID